VWAHAVHPWLHALILCLTCILGHVSCTLAPSPWLHRPTPLPVPSSTCLNPCLCLVFPAAVHLHLHMPMHTHASCVLKYTCPLTCPQLRALFRACACQHMPSPCSCPLELLASTCPCLSTPAHPTHPVHSSILIYTCPHPHPWPCTLFRGCTCPPSPHHSCALMYHLLSPSPVCHWLRMPTHAHTCLHMPALIYRCPSPCP